MKKSNWELLESEFSKLKIQFEQTEMTLKDAAIIISEFINKYPQFTRAKIDLIRDLKLNRYPNKSYIL
jgi:hypothetical protein